ncbi:MAG: glycosyltransferase family 2 protein [Geminicoccaceae bacterium]|nr:glycosyltransferase family 2 protein [Geminicoccaceae bacterium]MDW8124813.1 glycosyltransferase [Geminicoccaceae bacterium]
MSVFVQLALLSALLAYAPEPLFDPEARSLLFFLGVVGVWRYGWGAVHLLRALWFRFRVFPRLRRRAEALVAAGGLSALVPELVLVTTIYRIPPETVAASIRAALAEAARTGLPTTLVAALVEPADLRLVKTLVRSAPRGLALRLVLLRLPPTGKRRALAAALRAVARRCVHPDAAVVVMDGDALLTPGSLVRALPFLGSDRALAALTTDQDARTTGGALLRAWFRLRFARRHLLFCSLALSRKLLAVTGRMAIYRAKIATDPDLLARIENDGLEHWRLGRIRFLTGEDKSTWLWILERRLPMLYVPDVRVLTVEHPPASGFFAAATPLLVRWSGNMLRGGRKALALGPGRIGPFLWWCLVDQRVSIWTPLLGPLFVLALLPRAGPSLLWAYALWILATRLVLSLGLWAVSGRIDGGWPWLLWLDQVYGALVKGWVLFRLDRQRWTRQAIASPNVRFAFGREIGSSALHLLALATLGTAVAFATGLLSSPAALVPVFRF